MLWCTPSFLVYRLVHTNNFGVHDQSTPFWCTWSKCLVCLEADPKNLQSNWQSKFSENGYAEFIQLWNYLVASNSKSQYKKNLNKLQSLCPPTMIEYLRANWLPLKDRFVRYLINNCLQFGNLTTSWAESLHAAVKRFLKGATSLMNKTISDMKDAATHQLHKILISTATQKTFYLNNIPDVLAKLSGKISHHVLKEAHCQYLLPTQSQECIMCS
jgi:hypothetical protein